MHDGASSQEQDRLEIRSEDLPEDTPSLVVELDDEPDQSRPDILLQEDSANPSAARRELQRAAVDALKTRARPRMTPFMVTALIGLGVGLIPAVAIVLLLRHQQALLPVGVAASGAAVALLAGILDRATWRTWVMWIRGPAAGVEVPLRGDGPWLIGSRRGAHIRVKGDPSVSPEHARLQRGPNGITFEDLGGAGSSALNRAPVQGPQRLCDGDVISVGDCAFVFHHPYPVRNGGVRWTQGRSNRTG